MKLEVEKEDINKIGNVWSNENGFLAIICNGDTANIEEILLRNVLKCFGEEYHIVSAEDFIWEEDDYDEWDFDIEFITNLPYEIFEKLD